MNVVIDASALIESLLTDDVVLPGDAVWHAPHVIDVEVVSSFRRLARTDRLPLSAAREALELMLGFEIRRHALRRLLPRMWDFRHDITPTDASYVALAESLGFPLVTTDHRLARTATRYCDVITP